MVDAISNNTLFGYDALGNRTSMTDPNGNTTTYDFDELNRMIATNKPLGITTKYTWNQLNRIGMTDPNGNEAIFNYDGRNLLVSQVDAVGNTTFFEYDDKGNRLSMLDPNGNITSYEYDAIDQMVLMTDAIGGTITYQYDPNGNQIAVTDQLGNTIQMSYDALDRSIQVTNAIGGIAVYEYDDNNNQTKVTDQNGNATNFVYDSLDRMTSMTDALGNTVTTSYDLVGNQLVNTDANGNATTNGYDCINRLTSTTNAENETTTFGYDNNSNQTSITTPNGNVINYTFDAVNRVTNITDNIGEVATMTYDLNSNTLSQTDGNGNASTMTYDGINRVIEQTDALGESSILSYDNNSNVLSQTDRNGNTTSMEYDALNRRTKTTDAIGNETLSFYDGVNNLIELEDAKGSSTLYEFDDLYRMTKETYADGTTKEYTFDAVGNVLTRKDNNGAITNYAYDEIYRLLNRDYPDTNDDVFTYDAAGRMLTAVNENAIITYNYDQANRILGENLNGQSTAYGYDIPNNKRNLTYPSGRNIEENYDQRSRLEIIKDTGVDLATFQYDLGNRITQKTYANGTQSFLNYNDNNWTTQITHNNGNNFADLFYTHDKEGNKTSTEFLHKTDHSEKYEYDDIYRLTNFQKGILANGNIATPTTQTQYNLDALGNRNSITKDGNITDYLVNEMNEHTLIEPLFVAPTNDDNGNLTSDGSKIFQYNFENRLLSIDDSINYAYGPFGRRLQKNVNVKITDYYYDGARVVEEQDETNATVTTFVYGTWIDDVVNMQRGEANYFYHQNHLGSVVAVTNATGNLTEQYEYDAYGKVTIYNATFDILTNSIIDNPYLFTGRRLDSESGLYYYRARHYDAATGRFMQRDPLGYVDGMNLFEYVGGNVVSLIDPLGLSPQVSTFSGINSYREKQDAFEPYVSNRLKGIHLDKKGNKKKSQPQYWPGFIGPHRYFTSQSGTRAPYWKPFDDKRCLIPFSETNLDWEARIKARDSIDSGGLCRCNKRTKIKVLLVAPKTNTYPLPSEESCCDIEFVVYWSDRDKVFNQGIFNPLETQRYWRNWGGNYTFNVNHGISEPTIGEHGFNGFVDGKVDKLKNGINPFSKGSEYAPHPIHDFVRPWYRGNRPEYKDIDHIFIGHSQGTNILMHILNKGCTKSR